MTRLRTATVLLACALALAACNNREVVLLGERFDVRDELPDEVSAEGPFETEERRARVGAPREVPEIEAVALTLPPQVDDANWTHLNGGTDHLPPHAAFVGTPSRVWSTSIGAGNSRKHRITADPIVADGRVFTLDARSRVTATSTSGSPIWQADIRTTTDRDGDASGGGLAYGDGSVYATTGFGALVALDAATGERRWVQDLDASATGTPTVVDDLVYVVSRDARAWAVEADNGRVRWTLQGTPAGSGIVGGPGPAVNDRIAVFPFTSGELVAVLRSGGLRIWSASVQGQRRGRAYAAFGDITGDPVLAGEVIYAGTSAGRTIAIDAATGDRLWTATEGALNPVAPVGEAVFTVSDESQLVRLDRDTGETVWAVPLPYFTKERLNRRKAIYPHYGPVLAGGRLWIGGGDGVLRGFDPENGALMAEASLPGGAASNPVIAGGTLYILGGGGQLHAFR